MTDKKADGIDEDEAEKQAAAMIDNFYDFEADIKIIIAELLPLWLNAGELGNGFFNAVQFVKPEDGTLFSLIRDDYLEWLKEYGGEQIKNINETTKQITKQIIKEGLVNGDSVNTIANNLSDKIAEYTKGRAVMIAETETHNSFMKGNFMSATSSGFKYKTWLTANDNAVRFSHRSLSGKKVKIEDDFKSGLAHPGDSRAPAKETIRCRCVLTYS